MAFEDKIKTCEDCGKEFTFTAAEQEFYQERGFENEPKRCPACRDSRKQQRRTDRVETEITCAECGKKDTVPFKPSGDRPVLCRDCFQKTRR